MPEFSGLLDHDLDGVVIFDGEHHAVVFGEADDAHDRLREWDGVFHLITTPVMTSTM